MFLKCHVPITPSIPSVGPCQQETDSMRYQLMWPPATITHSKRCTVMKRNDTKKMYNLVQHGYLRRTRLQYKMLLQQSTVACRTLRGTLETRLKHVAQQPGGWLVLWGGNKKQNKKNPPHWPLYIFLFILSLVKSTIFHTHAHKTLFLLIKVKYSKRPSPVTY